MKKLQEHRSFTYIPYYRRDIYKQKPYDLSNPFHFLSVKKQKHFLNKHEDIFVMQQDNTMGLKRACFVYNTAEFCKTGKLCLHGTVELETKISDY